MAPTLLDVEVMIGEVVGNYEVLSCIGEGGMGAVYLARHRLIGRRAAIKVLLPGTCTNDEIVQRFFNEARSTSEVKHAGLIDVFDFGYHKGSAYIAMEFLEGESLASRLHREPRPAVELVAAVGRQVASALAAAHARGIVHRDLKPDNIFLIPDDEVAIGLRAKVLDFGIAKLADNNSAGSLKTRTNSLMGTPAYMSPEQCRGAKAVDARSDIYSLGCILFEMSTGRTPFVTEGLGEMMMAHMINEPPPPRALNPNVPEWLEQVVCRAMAKRVDERYQSMEELASLLGARLSALREVTVPASLAAGTPLSATLRAAADSVVSQAQPPAHVTPVPGSLEPRRSRKLLAGIAVVALASMGAGAWLIMRPADSPIEQAAEPAEPAKPAVETVPSAPAPPEVPTPAPTPAPASPPEPASIAAEAVTPSSPPTAVDTAPSTSTPASPAKKSRGTKPKTQSQQRETGSAAAPRHRRDGTLDPFAKEGGS